LRIRETPDISELIKQMGADQFRQREDAMKAIRAIGPGTIDQLRKAADGPDAEIADRAETLIKQLSGGLFTTAERRLMAIRTLGELKQREALPHLEKLLESKEPFIAEYSTAAIAAIEGKSFKRPRPTQKQRDEDLYLMPKECVFVLQAGADERINISWDQILRLLAQIPNGQERNAAVAKYEKAFRTLLGRAGNVRIDLATVCVAGQIFADNGLCRRALRQLTGRLPAPSQIRRWRRDETRQRGRNAQRHKGVFRVGCLRRRLR
jgi:HEAT repeat protein